MSPYLGGGHGDQGDAPAGAVGVTNGRVVLLDDVDHGAHPQGHQLISQDETLIPVPVLPAVKHGSSTARHERPARTERPSARHSR